ncbi:D-aminoacyl-tRNA deacylase [Methanobrevibacter sp.]|uniref:D-aminoacyl-tRNA deacylase n=1 Tax=Methanobrevibacter sp. TaxID=66852 RepID=UPI0025DEB39B|nr:D-aminoacyl-tRNA deacylase [Methanobrevibacter sp.]MBQ6512397.1 D-tyrosyl-tRNA(Tyr) deacylase [Methanobrevibacter sp.]
MKLVVQRVTDASVEVDGEIVGEIGEGLMVLVGFGVNDTAKEADYLAKKLVKLRIFQDENGRMNKSVKDIGGKLLLVPQFTLYGSTKKNRPSFHKALNPEDATELFDYFTNQCSESVDVETGEFGAYMKVSLLNNGPVTILLEKEFED